MRHRTIIAASVLVAAIASISFVALALGGPRDSAKQRGITRLSADGLQFSNNGDEIIPTAAMEANLRRLSLSARAMRRLDTRQSGMTFYAVDTVEHGRCFAVSLTAGARAQLDSGECPDHYFPSTYPVVDLSTARVDSGIPAHLSSVQGIAVDGVATVQAVRDDGTVVVETPVIRNTYRIDPDQLGTAAVAVRALDASGAVVYSEAFN